jgi:hypothetical protein
MKPFKMMMTTTMTCMEEKNHYANKSEFQVGFKPRIVYSSFNHRKRPSDALYMIKSSKASHPLFILHSLSIIVDYDDAFRFRITTP